MLASPGYLTPLRRTGWRIKLENVMEGSSGSADNLFTNSFLYSCLNVIWLVLVDDEWLWGRRSVVMPISISTILFYSTEMRRVIFA